VIRERRLREVEEAEGLLASINADSSEEEVEEVSVDEEEAQVVLNEQVFVEAEAEVAWADHEGLVREAEEAEELLLARESEVEEMIGVNKVSKITVIAPAASAFVVVPADLVSTQMSFFGPHPPPPPPLPQSQTLTDPRSIPIRRSERLCNKERVQCASTSDNEVEGSSEGGVPRASPLDNEVEGSSDGGVPCVAPSDDRNRKVLAALYHSVDGSDAPPVSTEEGDSIGNKVGPGDDDAMVAPSIPPARRNPDRAVWSARGGSVASLRTSDEPTDFEQSSSDNIFEQSSDDESTEDVFSLSAYEQVESEVNDSDEDIEDNESNEDNDDEDHEDDKDDEGRDEEMTNESNVNNAAFNDADNNSNAPVAAEIGSKDIMISVHCSKLSSHPGSMRAIELALLNYKEYSQMKSYLVKRALAAKLIQRLVNEGRRFLKKTSNGWITMTDEQTRF